MHLRKSSQKLGLIWVDAHADMNNPSSSESGNVHGMPLAALLGTGPAELSAFAGDAPSVLARHTVLVGIRNLDDTEKQIVRASKVHVFTMKEIDRLWHRRGDGARDLRLHRKAPAGSTSRTISTSAIPPWRRASARRSRAA